MKAAKSSIAANHGKAFSDCSHRFSLHRGKALELFASKGFAEVGMRELAAFLGLTPGALYHHYPSKQHLLFDFIEEFYDELIAGFNCKNAVPTRSIGHVIDMHLSLHNDLPSHFKIAMRGTVSLLPYQQEAVLALKFEYQLRLKAALGFAENHDEETIAAVAAIALLLSGAPTWLSELPVPTTMRRSVIRHALTGAIEKIVRSRCLISYESAYVL